MSRGSSPSASILRTPKGLDPAGTVKRLTTALQELDRLKAERSSYQAQNSVLQLECDRLLEQREGSLQEENRRLRDRVTQLELEREQLIATLRELEASDKVASLRDMEDMRRTFALLESRLEASQTQVLQYQETIDSLQQQLAQSSQDLTTLEMERKELLSKLAVYIQREADLTRDHFTRKSVHTRHSRLLASVILIDRASAYIRRSKAKGWTSLMRYIQVNHRIVTGMHVLRTAVARRKKLNMRRRLVYWWEEVIRSKGEADKSALYHGFNLSLSKQNVCAIWRTVAFRFAAKHRNHAHKQLLHSFLDRLFSQKDQKHRQERLLSSFLGWKGAYLALKRDHFQSEFHSVTLQTQSLHANLTLEQQHHQRTLTLKALQVMLRQSKGQLFTAFSTWRQVAGIMKTQVPRLVKVIRRWKRGNEGRAISTWKAAVGIGKLDRATERIAVLAREVADFRAFHAKYKDKTVRKMMKFATKHQLNAGFGRWLRHSKMNTTKRTAARQIYTWILDYQLSVGWKLIVHRKTQKQAKLLLGNKLARLMVSDTKVRKKLLFDDWVKYIKSRKSARKVISKLLNEGHVEDKRKGILTWKDNAYALRVAEIHSQRDHLHRQLSDTSEKLLQYQKKIQFKCLLFLEKTVDDASKLKLWTGFSLWKTQSLDGKKQKQTTNRLLTLWKRHELRQGMRSWTEYVHFHRDFTWKTRLNALEMQLNEQKRELRLQKEGLSGEIEKNIEELTVKSEELVTSRKKFADLFEMFHKAKQAAILTRRFCFVSWKNSLKSTKKAYNLIGNLLKKRILRHSLQHIKKFANLEGKKRWLQRCICALMQNYRVSSLRFYTSKWKNVTNRLKITQFEANLTNEQRAKHEKDRVKLLVNDKFSRKMMEVSEKFVKLRVVQEWKNLKKFRQKLRFAEEKLNAFIEKNNAKVTFSRLKVNLKTRKIRKMQNSKVVTAMFGYQTKEIFRQWANRTLFLRKMTKSLLRIHRSLYVALVFPAFSGIYRHSLLSNQAISSSQIHKKRVINRVIVSILKSSISVGFVTWKNKVFRRNKYRKSLKKTMMSMLKRGLKAGWNTWTLQIRLHKDQTHHLSLKSATQITTSMVEKMLLIRKFLLKEGVEVKKAEKYVRDRETKGSARVELWSGRELQGVERCFALWKWMYCGRRRIRKATKMIKAYIRKPELINGFWKWKRRVTGYSKDVVRANKGELVRLLRSRTQDLGVALQRYEEVKGRSEEMEDSCEVLVSLVRKGQHQALHLLNLRTKFSLFQASFHWLSLTSKSSFLSLLSHSSANHSELQAANSYIQQITSESRALTQENEELRRSAADGMAFAEALEEVGQENRDLRLELAEKAEILQRMVKENEALAMRLRRVKVEETETVHKRVSSASMRFWQS